MVAASGAAGIPPVSDSNKCRSSGASYVALLRSSPQSAPRVLTARNGYATSFSESESGSTSAVTPALGVPPEQGTPNVVHSSTAVIASSAPGPSNAVAGSEPPQLWTSGSHAPTHLPPSSPPYLPWGVQAGLVAPLPYLDEAPLQTTFYALDGTPMQFPRAFRGPHSQSFIQGPSPEMIYQQALSHDQYQDQYHVQDFAMIAPVEVQYKGNEEHEYTTAPLIGKHIVEDEARNSAGVDPVGFACSESNSLCRQDTISDESLPYSVCEHEAHKSNASEDYLALAPTNNGDDRYVADDNVHSAGASCHGTLKVEEACTSESHPCELLQYILASNSNKPIAQDLVTTGTEKMSVSNPARTSNKPPPSFLDEGRIPSHLTNLDVWYMTIPNPAKPQPASSSTTGNTNVGVNGLSQGAAGQSNRPVASPMEYILSLPSLPTAGAPVASPMPSVRVKPPPPTARVPVALPSQPIRAMLPPATSRAPVASPRQPVQAMTPLPTIHAPVATAQTQDLPPTIDQDVQPPSFAAANQRVPYERLTRPTFRTHVLSSNSTTRTASPVLTHPRQPITTGIDTFPSSKGLAVKACQPGGSGQFGPVYELRNGESSHENRHLSAERQAKDMKKKGPMLDKLKAAFFSNKNENAREEASQGSGHTSISRRFGSWTRSRGNRNRREETPFPSPAPSFVNDSDSDGDGDDQRSTPSSLSGSSKRRSNKMHRRLKFSLSGIFKLKNKGEDRNDKVAAGPRNTRVNKDVSAGVSAALARLTASQPRRRQAPVDPFSGPAFHPDMPAGHTQTNMAYVQARLTNLGNYDRPIHPFDIDPSLEGCKPMSNRTPSYDSTSDPRVPLATGHLEPDTRADTLSQSSIKNEPKNGSPLTSSNLQPGPASIPDVPSPLLSPVMARSLSVVQPSNPLRTAAVGEADGEIPYLRPRGSSHPPLRRRGNVIPRRRQGTAIYGPASGTESGQNSSSGSSKEVLVDSGLGSSSSLEVQGRRYVQADKPCHFVRVQEKEMLQQQQEQEHQQQEQQENRQCDSIEIEEDRWYSVHITKPSRASKGKRIMRSYHPCNRNSRLESYSSLMSARVPDNRDQGTQDNGDSDSSTSADEIPHETWRVFNSGKKPLNTIREVDEANQGVEFDRPVALANDAGAEEPRLLADQVQVNETGRLAAPVAASTTVAQYEVDDSPFYHQHSLQIAPPRQASELVKAIAQSDPDMVFKGQCFVNGREDGDRGRHPSVRRPLLLEQPLTAEVYEWSAETVGASGQQAINSQQTYNEVTAEPIREDLNYSVVESAMLEYHGQTHRDIPYFNMLSPDEQQEQLRKSQYCLAYLRQKMVNSHEHLLAMQQYQEREKRRQLAQALMLQGGVVAPAVASEAPLPSMRASTSRSLPLAVPARPRSPYPLPLRQAPLRQAPLPQALLPQAPLPPIPALAIAPMSVPVPVPVRASVTQDRASQVRPLTLGALHEIARMAENRDDPESYVQRRSLADERCRKWIDEQK
ncbi:hypothetical protein BG004_004718 [Podila humilis]|nr:hypothetical protein BG004_004718 [Podila humilis]